MRFGFLALMYFDIAALPILPIALLVPFYFGPWYYLFS